MRKHGPWGIHTSELMYSDPWMRVQRDQVTRPDGNPGTYAVVQLKSGVCVVALDSERQVHLTKEFHYAVGSVTIEGVSGGIEEGESSDVAAKRELAEEIGLTAKQWTHLGTVDPFTAAIYSRVDLYLAEQLSPCAKSPEGTELIEHVSFDLDDAVEMVRQGAITHSPTCVLLLRLALDF